MSRLFNAYVIVDWSAAAKPATGKNSIWIGVLRKNVRFQFVFEAHNPPTRADAERQIAALLDDLAKRGDRVLLGFDFPLGFPRGTAAKLKLASPPPWQAMHALLAKEIKDRPDNANNRYPVAASLNYRLSGGPFPFWGCTERDAVTTLTVKRGREHTPEDLPEFRHADEAMKGAHSVWKLAFAGSVGSQTLLGIPAVRRLKAARGDRIRLWPFETGWKAISANDLDGVEAVVAEVYPSMVLKPGAASGVPDEAQVKALAEHFAALDERGRFAALFAPKKEHEAFADAVTQEEGWILGA